MTCDNKDHGDKPIEFCGDQEGWIAVDSLTDDSPNSPCYPRVVLLGVGLGPSGKAHPSNIAAMLTVEQATDLRTRLTEAIGVDRPAPTPTPAPGLDLDAVEAAERAMTAGPWKAELDVFDMEHEGIVATICDEPVSFLASIPCDLTMSEAEWTRAEADAQWRHAKAGQQLRDAAGIVALRNAAPAMFAEVRALRAEVAERRETASRQLAAIGRVHDRISAKLAEAKRLGRDACELAKAYADDAREYGGGDTTAADAIAAALEAL